MLRRRVVLPCLLLVVGAMGAVSCGGGGGDSASHSEQRLELCLSRHQ